LRSEAIQHPKFVCGAIEVPGVAARSLFLEWKGREGWCFLCHGDNVPRILAGPTITELFNRS
jgi:hypothetical protein